MRALCVANFVRVFPIAEIALRVANFVRVILLSMRSAKRDP